MHRIRPFFVTALILGAAVVLGLAACEGGKSPTEPQVPSLEAPAAASSAAAQEAESAGAGEQQSAEAGAKGAVAEARADNVTICHRTGKGVSQAITVAEAAVAAHLAHGDVMAGTGGLDENCQPAVTPEPTGTPADTPVPRVTETPTGTATNTPEAPSATPVDTATNTPEAPSATPTDTATNTPEPPTVTPTATLGG